MAPDRGSLQEETDLPGTLPQVPGPSQRKLIFQLASCHISSRRGRGSLQEETDLPGTLPQVPSLRYPPSGTLPQVPSLRYPPSGTLPQVPSLRYPPSGTLPQVPVGGGEGPKENPVTPTARSTSRAPVNAAEVPRMDGIG